MKTLLFAIGILAVLFVGLPTSLTAQKVASGTSSVPTTNTQGGAMATIGPCGTDPNHVLDLVAKQLRVNRTCVQNWYDNGLIVVGPCQQNINKTCYNVSRTFVSMPSMELNAQFRIMGCNVGIVTITVCDFGTTHYDPNAAID
jgi:hypothetical protein